MLPGSAPGGRPPPLLHVHPTAYRYTGGTSPSAPGGMAVIYRNLIASALRTLGHDPVIFKGGMGPKTVLPRSPGSSPSRVGRR